MRGVDFDLVVRMSVGKKQIEVAIVVEVEKFQLPIRS